MRRYIMVAVGWLVAVVPAMSITGHKTHVMLHRYSHSNDQIRMDAVEGLPEPKNSGGNNVVS